MAKPSSPFPTHHPLVQNPDGSHSNVRTMTVGINDRTYVLPSMVGGKQLEEEDAIRLAERRGLRNYPSFATHDKAEQWIEQNHGSQDPEANAPMQGWYSQERGRAMPKGIGYPNKMSAEAREVSQQAQEQFNQAIARAFGGSQMGVEASPERPQAPPVSAPERQPSARMQQVLQMALGQTDEAIEQERRRRRRQQILNDAFSIINQSALGRGTY